MNYLRNKFIELFEYLNIKPVLAEIVSDVTLLVLLILAAIIIYFILRFIYLITFQKMGNSIKNLFLSELLKSSLTLTLLKVVSIYLVSRLATKLLSIKDFISIVFSILITFMIVKIINSILDLINRVYENHNKQAGVKPIRGLINFAKAIIFMIALILVVADLINQSPMALLTGLGAMSAVLMLIFKDTILGLVAGFQMSGNDLIRIGDWIELPKYNVDGNVIDVTLTFIKIENWDKTIVTIPAYLLVSDSFINWRNVFKTGGRRIKRSLNIDSRSVKVVNDELYAKLLKIDLIKNYLVEKKKEIDESNQNIDTSIHLNGRRLTNLGVFRIYVTEYLKQNKNIHQEKMLFVRQLQNQNQGIPLEIYAFSNQTSIVDYERVQADIFDHIYANINYFELRLFQEPQGYDFLNIE
ncbi:MAG: mechanosensitive ion channel domain-containing protein [Acholeplasmataceae bacterium]|nr:mechanosensitive ion channel family protein [Acholeplasmataceae bacterium]